MLVGVEEDVAVALPKRVVATLELSLLSEEEGLNGDSLMDSVVLLNPNVELPNTDVGLDAASEVPNTLAGLVVAKTFTTLLELRLSADEVGRGELADERSASWLEDTGTDLDVVSSMMFDVVVDVFEGANVKTDFGGSGVVADDDMDDSLGLGVRSKGKWVGAEVEGGTNGGNVKPPVFVPLSLGEGNLGVASADPIEGFGMENNGVVFSGGGWVPKMGAELVVAGPRIVDGCEERSNSD